MKTKKEKEKEATDVHTSKLSFSIYFLEGREKPEE
jgi:hypothetical protein